MQHQKELRVTPKGLPSDNPFSLSGINLGLDMYTGDGV